jgi:hypothetical protein
MRARTSKCIALAALTIACAPAPSRHSELPDQATRKQGLAREATCAPATRRVALPFIGLNMDKPDPDPQVTSLLRPPAELRAQHDRLATCFRPGEQLALSVESREGRLHIETLCQVARPETVECVRQQLSPIGSTASVSVILAAHEQTSAEIDAYVDDFESHYQEFADCHAGLRKIYPGASGEILFGLFIGADGSVQGTDVLDNTTGVFELACCIENRMSSWKFPAGQCATHIVRIPFR